MSIINVIFLTNVEKMAYLSHNITTGLHLEQVPQSSVPGTCIFIRFSYSSRGIFGVIFWIFKFDWLANFKIDFEAVSFQFSMQIVGYIRTRNISIVRLVNNRYALNMRQLINYEQSAISNLALLAYIMWRLGFRVFMFHCCNVDVVQRGHSALFEAMDSGHVGIVALLLDFMYSVHNKVRKKFHRSSANVHDYSYFSQYIPTQCRGWYAVVSYCHSVAVPMPSLFFSLNNFRYSERVTVYLGAPPQIWRLFSSLLNKRQIWRT